MVAAHCPTWNPIKKTIRNAANSSNNSSPNTCETIGPALLLRCRIRDFGAKKHPPRGGLMGELKGEPGWGMLFLKTLLHKI
jgi:hypothetical protein